MVRICSQLIGTNTNPKDRGIVDANCGLKAGGSIECRSNFIVTSNNTVGIGGSLRGIGSSLIGGGSGEISRSGLVGG